MQAGSCGAPQQQPPPSPACNERPSSKQRCARPSHVPRRGGHATMLLDAARPCPPARRPAHLALPARKSRSSPAPPLPCGGGLRGLRPKRLNSPFECVDAARASLTSALRAAFKCSGREKWSAVQVEAHVPHARARALHSLSAFLACAMQQQQRAMQQRAGTPLPAPAPPAARWHRSTAALGAQSQRKAQALAGACTGGLHVVPARWPGARPASPRNCKPQAQLLEHTGHYAATQPSVS